jgi:cystathionine beta-lyase family protein involved in aluminum resistance
MNFDVQLLKKAAQAEQMCADVFKRFDETARFNSEKVLRSFINNRVSEHHLRGSNGYGYTDEGRETLDRVFAEVVGADGALVRHGFINGTHAITTALFGVLRTGDRLVSVTGKPYDTLHGVISGDYGGSLKEYGIQYSEVPLFPDSTADLDSIKRNCADCKAVFIQRSRGYSLRKPLTVAQIGEITAAVREVNPGAVIIVDNCYGEFCECTEPVQSTGCVRGADLIVGSLIKNPGGGIAETGGYIAGKRELAELCACRLTAPGIGSEAGCTLSQNRGMYLGLFYAPEVTANALKTSAFALALMKLLGYECFPDYDEYRTDIIAAINLGGEREVRAFCEGLQSGSPIDSFAAPQPWDMPGYNSKVIMAAGAFTSGASIELSADAPIREPYTVFVQGGLTFHTGRIGVLSAAQKLINLEK